MILRVLKEANRPVGSAQIHKEMVLSGHDISERTLRLYLQDLDNTGLTIRDSKRKSTLSDYGLKELEVAKIIERVSVL